MKSVKADIKRLRCVVLGNYVDILVIADIIRKMPDQAQAEAMINNQIGAHFYEVR